MGSLIGKSESVILCVGALAGLVMWETFPGRADRHPAPHQPTPNPAADFPAGIPTYGALSKTPTSILFAINNHCPAPLSYMASTRNIVHYRLMGNIHNPVMSVTNAFGPETNYAQITNLVPGEAYTYWMTSQNCYMTNEGPASATNIFVQPNKDSPGSNLVSSALGGGRNLVATNINIRAAHDFSFQ